MISRPPEWDTLWELPDTECIYRLKTGEREYTSDLNIEYGSMKIYRTLFSRDKLIGNTPCFSLECCIQADNNDIPRGAIFKAEVALRNEGVTTDYIPMGEYKIYERSQESDGWIYLSLRDRMQIANQAYFTEPVVEDEWPKSMTQVLEETLPRVGITLDPRVNVPSGKDWVVTPPVGKSIRAVWGYIAAALGGNFYITPENRLMLSHIKANPHTEIRIPCSNDSYQSLGDIMSIDQLTLMINSEAGFSSGESGSNDISIECPYANPTVVDYARSMLDGSLYYPISAEELLINPAMEMCDSCIVESESRESLLVWSTLDINCGPIYSGSGSSEPLSEPSSEYGFEDTPLNNLIGEMKDYAIGVVEGLSQEEIFNKLTNNGSSQGIYILDGQLYFNASYIKTGTLEADLIKTGILKSKDETFILNLDTGVLKLTGYPTTEEFSQLQSQVDGQIQTWFYNYAPTLDNEPAVNWTDSALKDAHLGDVFYVVDNETQGGQAYRWAKVNNVYKWILIEDVEVAKALADAAKAQDTADGKRRVFVNTPVPPYDVGDLWAQGTSGDLMRCNKARQTGAYKESDWGKATDYTNDDNLNKFIAGKYQTTVDKVAELVTTSESITARVEQTETTVSTVEDNLNNLSVGGTNLLIDSDAPSVTRVAAEHSRTFTSMVTNGDAIGVIEPLPDSPCGTKNVVRIGIVNAGAGGTAGYRFYSATQTNAMGISFVPGEQYTLSCYARAVAGEPQINITIWGLTAWGWKAVDTEWAKFSLTFEATEKFNTTTSAWAVFQVKKDVLGTVEFTGFKLEKGNKATDWSPSPDEAQYAIDNLQIGARNLQLGTQYWDDTCIRLPGKAVIDKEEIIIPTNTYTELEKIQVKNGEVYTIGCDVKSDVAYDGNSFLVQFFNEAGTRLSYEWATGSIGTDWSRVVKTLRVTRTESPLFLGIGLRANSGVEGVACTLTYGHMMVERGNRATDWAPAQADVESQITTTSQKTAELVLKNSGITGTVSDIDERVKDVEGTLVSAEKKGIFDLTAENLSIKFTEKLNNADGVHITGKNFDFNKKGLTIANEGFSMQNLLDEEGMEVTRDGEGILSATKDGVNAIDLTARQYLIVGKNARFEDYGTGRTACFWIGG